ncbi:uncharacterized protein [Macrobrachium rosenbergii]|uniref:uncharacterized protein n=1 Tax=Macrobrachium rosenbergii TaxID=79674 RepID=UPI0034D5A185
MAAENPRRGSRMRAEGQLSLFGSSLALEGLLLQRRWKFLRDFFRRELKAQKAKSGDGGSIRKKYMDLDHLLCLTSTRDERPTCSNYPSPQCDQDEVLEEGTSEVTPTKLATILKPQKQREIKENTKKSYEELIDVLKKKAHEDIDEDKSFLLSLLPKFQKFSDDQKFEAQIEILKILRRLQQKSTQESN